MGGKIAIYNLGQLGVDVVKSPVHIDDGAFTAAQNAQIDSVQGVGGIRRRDGIAKLNSSPLAGAVTGVLGLPLPDNSSLARHFFIGIDDLGGAATGSWRTSTNGSSWSTIAAAGPPSVPESINIRSTLSLRRFFQCTRWASLNNKIYYPSNTFASGGNPQINVFDGVTDAVLCEIPPNPYVAAQTAPLFVMSIVPYSSTQLIVSMEDDTGSRGRVLLLDVTNGQLTHLGPDTDITAAGTGEPLCPVVYQGRIWYGSFNESGGTNSRVFWIRPGDRTWTRDPNGDTILAANGYVCGAAVYKGNIYMGYAADVGNPAILRKRTTSSGAWTTVKTSGSAVVLNAYSALITSPDGLTLYFYENAGNFTTGGTSNANEQVIWSYDGTTFTNSYDVGLNNTNAYVSSGYPCFDANGDLYWPVLQGNSSVAKILKRAAAGGAWSVVDSGVNLRGPLMRISY